MAPTHNFTIPEFAISDEYQATLVVQGLLKASGIEDSAGTLTVQLVNELIAQKSELILTEFGPIKALEQGLVPLTAEPAPPGADEAQYSRLTDVGVAELIDGNADDFPEVDGALVNFSAKLVTPAISYSWSIQDVWRRDLQRVKVDQEKPRMARMAIARKVDELYFIGVAGLGVGGLTNQPNVPLAVVANGSWDLPATTGEEIVLDLLELEEVVIGGTRENHYPDTFLHPGSLTQTLLRPYSATNEPSKTIWDIFTERSQLRELGRTWRRVRSDFFEDVGGNQRVLMYEASNDVLEGDLPIPFQELAPVQGLAKITIPTVARIVLLQVKRPLGMVYCENCFAP